MDAIRIRRVSGRTNSALIRRLQRKILPADVPASSQHGWWWLAFAGDTPVGFAGLYPSVQWIDAMYLCRAGVLEDYRGRGLQKRLIAVRERAARRMGMRWLVTDTYQNPPSSNSLISSGFRLFEPSSPWGAEGVLYWRKRLD